MGSFPQDGENGQNLSYFFFLWSLGDVCAKFFIHKALKHLLRFQRGSAVDFLVKHSLFFLSAEFGLFLSS